VESVREEQPLSAVLPVGAVVRAAAPRLVRDGFGPLAIFFAGWKLVGLSAGILMALAFGVAVFSHERRQGRPAMIVRVALLFVLIRAAVGLSSGSAHIYLAQEAATDTLIGCLVLGLLARGRPLAALFAHEVYPLPAEATESQAFALAMRRITLVWGVYFLARAVVRLTALLLLSTNHYVVVSAISDAPFLVAILAWSVHHTAGALQASGAVDGLTVAVPDGASPVVLPAATMRPASGD
jgi:intracellular septation protein A